MNAMKSLIVVLIVFGFVFLNGCTVFTAMGNGVDNLVTKDKYYAAQLKLKHKQKMARYETQQKQLIGVEEARLENAEDSLFDVREENLTKAEKRHQKRLKKYNNSLANAENDWSEDK